MKKETIPMDAKLMFLWMTWIFQLHNHNQLETKVIPHYQKKKKKIFDASDSSTSFNDVVILLAENIRGIGLEINKSIAFEVLIQQKSEMAIQESALKLYPTLCEVEGLTEDECYHALSKIPDHPTQMLIFFSLPSAVRLKWVGRFLADH
ncbi:DNA replication terminus site-binding [Gossypium arboreum]|uniref:DNA replication terminus site-binding n=1 Tax=Gossypium arboreum TaxID=29729 RepID=A0A0B0NBM1_GOSAR|nr:DNA replication terminus site-binding [Gossypium arboreum]